jgi:hypothetical protein
MIINDSSENILQSTPLVGLPSWGFMVQPVSVSPVYRLAPEFGI